MAVSYKVVSKRPGGMAGQNAPKYYPVLTNRRVADLHEICDIISDRSTFSHSDVAGVVEAFVRLVPELLQDGYNVRLGDMGTFMLHASATGKDAPEKVSQKDITGLKMGFLPSKRDCFIVFFGRYIHQYI